MKYNLEEAYAMKSLVENLFGRNAWYEVKHSTDIKTWKKYAIRILSAISVTAHATVQIADPDWHKELDSIVQLGKDRMKYAKDTEAVFASLAGTLGMINFHQFGQMPQNLTKSKVTLRHQSNWKLDQFRSVQYVQNSSQAKLKEAHNKSRHRTQQSCANA